MIVGIPDFAGVGGETATTPGRRSGGVVLEVEEVGVAVVVGKADGNVVAGDLVAGGGIAISIGGLVVVNLLVVGVIGDVAILAVGAFGGIVGVEGVFRDGIDGLVTGGVVAGVAFAIIAVVGVVVDLAASLFAGIDNLGGLSVGGSDDGGGGISAAVAGSVGGAEVGVVGDGSGGSSSSGGGQGSGGGGVVGDNFGGAVVAAEGVGDLVPEIADGGGSIVDEIVIAVDDGGGSADDFGDDAGLEAALGGGISGSVGLGVVLVNIVHEIVALVEGAVGVEDGAIVAVLVLYNAGLGLRSVVIIGGDLLLDNHVAIGIDEAVSGEIIIVGVGLDVVDVDRVGEGTIDGSAATAGTLGKDGEAMAGVEDLGTVGEGADVAGERGAAGADTVGETAGSSVAGGVIGTVVIVAIIGGRRANGSAAGVDGVNHGVAGGGIARGTIGGGIAVARGRDDDGRGTGGVGAGAIGGIGTATATIGRAAAVGTATADNDDGATGEGGRGEEPES